LGDRLDRAGMVHRRRKYTTRVACITPPDSITGCLKLGSPFVFARVYLAPALTADSTRQVPHRIQSANECTRPQMPLGVREGNFVRPSIVAFRGDCLTLIPPSDRLIVL
jgi:hypothetical protein